MFRCCFVKTFQLLSLHEHLVVTVLELYYLRSLMQIPTINSVIHLCIIHQILEEKDNMMHR
jgi:hypothetical protein